ncbi:SDR family oxidoreductase [Bosea sp. BK604]|uniref:NAD-dependent epimerase/dehydratase family protein n=1 Tax=Bosea sp. BK604 TaxID=2512180 RepID=UPI0010533416|nr:SDR family oxidoreductase [Bosea sp. BK604]TCR61510.1 nucleoside-diphosphate-sugar epimerase [Bosea sp. BK604]
MRVLLTGADGYIGTVLGARLLDRGHDVVGLDTGFYRRGWLFEDGLTRPSVLTKDLRDIGLAELAGADAVVHLSELSNDPLGENDPSVTFAINHEGSVRLARLCKAAGIARFVYASSCSIYGAGGSEAKTELSSLHPQTAYARCKILVEEEVRKLSDIDFVPVFLRNATAFGASPRQRFDLVLNNLAAWAHAVGEIRMTSDGTPWRPLVHVEDICSAVLYALEAPREAVAGEAFNVGDNDQNYTVRDIAEIVRAAFPNCRITYGPASGDNRSYRVCFDKIRERMPGFRCAWSAERGALQLRSVFERIQLDLATLNAPPFTRLEELKYLRRTGQINESLRWTTGTVRPDSVAA